MKIFKMVGCLTMLVVALCFWSNNSQAKEVVIGFTGPLSGPAAEYGLNCVNGLDMAVKVIWGKMTFVDTKVEVKY